jgi:hypothetical protein
MPVSRKMRMMAIERGSIVGIVGVGADGLGGQVGRL